MKIDVRINGTPVASDVAPRVLLAEWLRASGSTGVKIGCDTSSCGACTVIVDGATVKSCAMLAVQADGSDVTTVEGIAADGRLSPVQRAFADEHALQCGFCTPGFVMSTTVLLRDDTEPDDAAIEDALEGNLCRCTGYTNIVRAVRRAAALLRGEAPTPIAGQGHEVAVISHAKDGRVAHEELGDTEVV